MDTSYPPPEARTRTAGRRAPGEVSASVASLQEGSCLDDRFRIGKKIGEGGMGAVWEATHLHTGSLVALKLLTSLEEGTGSERLLQEAQAAGALDSPRIVRVLDAGRLRDGRPYIVMERLRGESLRQHLARRGNLPVSEVIRVAIQVCEALQESHRAGVIHRDIKPSNLFLMEGAMLSIKLLDFGIAKVPTEAAALTGTGEVFGSPGYMSPEQMRNTKLADARSDLWSLGVVIHESLTGRLPFSATSAAGLALAIGADPPVPLRSLRPEVPLALEALVLRCLAKDPRKRPRSAGELRDALLALEAPRRRSHRWRLAGVASLLGLCGAWSLSAKPLASPPLASPPRELAASTPEATADAPSSASTSPQPEGPSAASTPQQPEGPSAASTPQQPEAPARSLSSTPRQKTELPRPPSRPPRGSTAGLPPSPSASSPSLTPEQLATAHSH